MAKKVERGTKRTCQNASCGSRFYDLARDPIACPVCGSVYALAMAAPVEEKARRPARKPEVVAPKAAAPEAEGEEALVDAEAGDEAIAADDDETFLEEEEEDGGDVSGIIGGPVGEES